MTIDEALELSDEGLLYVDSVEIMAILAAEVRRLREENENYRHHYVTRTAKDAMVALCDEYAQELKTAEAERDRYKAALERIADSSQSQYKDRIDWIRDLIYISLTALEGD